MAIFEWLNQRSKVIPTRRNVSDAKEHWKWFFDSAIGSLIDYEMRPEELARAVERAVIVADAALSALEDRFPNA